MRFIFPRFFCCAQSVSKVSSAELFKASNVSNKNSIVSEESKSVSGNLDLEDNSWNVNDQGEIRLYYGFPGAKNISEQATVNDLYDELYKLFYGYAVNNKIIEGLSTKGVSRESLYDKVSDAKIFVDVNASGYAFLEFSVSSYMAKREVIKLGFEDLTAILTADGEIIKQRGFAITGMDFKGLYDIRSGHQVMMPSPSLVNDSRLQR